MNTTRRRFLAASGSSAILAQACPVHGRTGSPLLSFGLMADCQFVDAPARGSRFYRRSPAKLKEAVESLNREDLAFTFHLGDFIDRDFGSFDVLEPIAAKLKTRLYHALGNHDFEVAEPSRPKVPRRLGLESGYYRIRREGFRFLVIDTTEVSTYRYAPDSDLTRKAEAELKQAALDKVKGAKPWNGRPGDGQVEWLARELREAESEGENALILGHHPIQPEEGHAVWNAQKLHQLLRDHPCAKLYLNGHNHAGAYVNPEGFHYLTLDGMVETEDTNAYAVADLYRDRLEIRGFGRQESRTLVFR